MSSEALERAARIRDLRERVGLPGSRGVPALSPGEWADDVRALLAEVARLEQERDEALSVREGLISPVQKVLQLRDELAEERRAALQDRGLLPASEGLTAGDTDDSPAVAPANDLWQKIQDQRAANAKLQRKYETVKGSLAAAEAALAVAREREQRLRDALQEMVAAHYSAGESERDSPREQLALRDARAALVDEPAAAGAGHNLCACGSTLIVCAKCGDSRCLVCDPYDELDTCGATEPAAATLAEPDERPGGAAVTRSLDADTQSRLLSPASGSASAAADEPCDEECREEGGCSGYCAGHGDPVAAADEQLARIADRIIADHGATLRKLAEDD